MDIKMKNIYLYTRYERSWHWLQMIMIFLLLITGFEVHGVIKLLGFEAAVSIHNTVGIAWLISFAFFVFWVFTTGEWKQYVPTTRKMLSVIRYYGYGIFRGEDHPVPKRKDAKHNPLQRISYLTLAAVLLPVQMGTGFLYWSYNHWETWGIGFLSLGLIAFLHTACAFMILQFVIIHVYMITTGHTLFAHLKAMITGWESVEENVHIEEWEKASNAKLTTHR
jgi:thiosulfate reductase cytochrome b subunit